MDEQQRALITAIAHPARLEVFDTLQASARPLSEREVLAASLGGRSGVRQHLHALKAVNLADHTDDAHWFAVPTPVVVPDLDDVPANDPDRPLVERMHQLLAERRIARMKHWSLIQRRPGWKQWRSAIQANDWTIHMTPDELGAMETEIMDVVRKHRDKLAGQPPRDNAEAVFVVMFAAPLDALRPRG